MANKHRYSIIPPSAVFQEAWPQSGTITQGKYGALSVGGWTSGNEGFIQQTFLGASIRSFNVSAGFGDSTSTMGIELVNDEFNKSDGSGLGKGDDPYHSGNGDGFNPPVVGSPVFFNQLLKLMLYFSRAIICFLESNFSNLFLRLIFLLIQSSNCFLGFG